MNENMELVLHIYKDAEMASYTLTCLLKKLKTNDNKIKSTVENILKGYERYLKDTKKILDKNGISPKASGIMSKMGASMGIDKEVMADNSDSSMADMLIKGITMGSLDVSKKIKDYEEVTDKKYLKLAKEFKEFQEENIEALKEYL